MGLLAAALTQHQLSSSEFNEISLLIKERILSVSSPERIYVFGSYARGTISGNSDLDLAIIFKNTEHLKFEKKKILNSKLFLDYSTDILFYDSINFEKKSSLWGVCSIIKSEGKLIYDQRTKV